MARLTAIGQLTRERGYDLGTGYHGPTGSPAYAAGGQVGTVIATVSTVIGTVKGVMAEDDGRLRSLLVDVGAGFPASRCSCRWEWWPPLRAALC